MHGLLLKWEQGTSQASLVPRFRSAGLRLVERFIEGKM